MFRRAGASPAPRPIPLFKKVTAKGPTPFCLGESRWQSCNCPPCRHKQFQKAEEAERVATLARERAEAHAKIKKEENYKKRSELCKQWTTELNSVKGEERRRVIEKWNLIFKKFNDECGE